MPAIRRSSFGPYDGYDVGERARDKYGGLLSRKAGSWPGDLAIDIECGHGTVVVTMARALKRVKFVATEEDAEQLARAVANARSEGLYDRIRFVRASPDALPFKDETFPLMTCALGLSSRDEPLDALEEMHRITQYYGKLLCVEADFSRLPRKPRGIAKDVVSDEFLHEMKHMGWGKLTHQKIDFLADGVVLNLLAAKRFDPEEGELDGEDEEAEEGAGAAGGAGASDAKGEAPGGSEHGGAMFELGGHGSEGGGGADGGGDGGD